MAMMISWFMANWMNVAVSLLLVDRALERLFPSSMLLKKIEAMLGDLGAKSE